LPASFATGILNSIIYGNYAVYTGGNSLKDLSKNLSLFSNTHLVIENDLSAG